MPWVHLSVSKRFGDSERPRQTYECPCLPVKGSVTIDVPRTFGVKHRSCSLFRARNRTDGASRRRVGDSSICSSSGSKHFGPLGNGPIAGERTLLSAGRTWRQFIESSKTTLATPERGKRRSVPTAHLVLDPSFVTAPVSPRSFGAFVEHMGRCVYTGIYEPD